MGLSRRSVFSMIGGLGVLALSGCGLISGLNRELDDIAEGVDGVDSSNLVAGPGGTFQPEVSGDIETSAPDEAALRPILEEVMRALAAHMIERGGDSADMRCGTIRALARDGSDFPASRLVPVNGDLMTFQTVAERLGT